MARPQTERRSGKTKRSRKVEPPLPDPRSPGPFRPFGCDPGWNEAWWWLVLPLAIAAFIAGSYFIDKEWHRLWVTEESGILETAQFIFMVVGLAIAAQLLFSPFVRTRPLVGGPSAPARSPSPEESRSWPVRVRSSRAS